jgi:hypothetical protein
MIQLLSQIGRPGDLNRQQSVEKGSLLNGQLPWFHGNSVAEAGSRRCALMRGSRTVAWRRPNSGERSMVVAGRPDERTSPSRCAESNGTTSTRRWLATVEPRRFDPTCGRTSRLMRVSDTVAWVKDRTHDGSNARAWTTTTRTGQ